MSCSQTFQVELAECCSSIVVDLTLEVFQYFPYYYNDGLPCDLTFCNTIYDSVTISFVERHTTKNISIQYITCV